MSAGELFDLIMPAAFVVSALLSTWVLASARKRLSNYYSFPLAIATLFLPLIVFPLYLALTLWIKKTGPPQKRRFLLPLVYAAVVLGAIVIAFYFDSHRVDAHLARATRARLVEDYAGAIREYREALALEDDPHTHKLLAIELTNEHSFSQAIAEFRLAERGGEPDDSIHYQIALLLERLNQPGQAKLEFQNFLLSDTCKNGDPRCDLARQRFETRQ